MAQATQGKREILRRLSTVTSKTDASVMLSRAMMVAGVDEAQNLDNESLLRICKALSGEGGLVQRIAEQIATATLGNGASG